MLKGIALAVVVLLLAVVPSAGAWTKLGSGGLDNSVDPSPVVLKDGTELVAFREPRARAVVVSVDGKPKTVAKGLASVGDPRLVQLPDGSLVLYVADQDGVVSYASQNGTSWTGPTKTKSTDTGDVQGAAARKDGTPLFSQDGTGFVNIFQGAAGAEVMHNIFTSCCGYAESLVVDSHNLAQIAFWSNASGHGGYLYGKLAADGALASLKTLSATSAENDMRVPLVADASGNTYVGFADGAPNEFVVETLHGGGLAHKVTLARGPFSGNEPLMALSVDASGRLWAVWTQGGSVWAARSRSRGAHFGATVHVASPGSTYALEAAARTDGSVDAIANNGTSLETQRLLPGLTVVPQPHGVKVLDDGFPVAGATVSGGGKTAKTAASGTAGLGTTVPAGTKVVVTATDYAPGSGVTG